MRRTYLIIGAILVGLLIIGIIGSLYFNRNGSLLVRVSPNNSEIKIDNGEFKRIENAYYTQLSKGNHKLEIKREGYEIYTQNFEIQSGEQKIIEISLKEKPREGATPELNAPITKTSTPVTTPATNQAVIADTNQNIKVNQNGSTAVKITNLNSLNFQGDLKNTLVSSNNAIRDAFYFSNGTWAVVVFINPAIQPSQSTNGIFRLVNNSWGQIIAPTEVFDNSIRDIVPADLYNFLFQNNMVISR